MKDIFSMYNLTHEVTDLKNRLNNLETKLYEYALTMEHIHKIEFYARADFDADESTKWIITVYLDIHGENGVRIHNKVEQTTVHVDPRLGYDMWKEQKTQDTPYAQEKLKEVSEKWGCKIIPLKI